MEGIMKRIYPNNRLMAMMAFILLVCLVGISKQALATGAAASNGVGIVKTHPLNKRDGTKKAVSVKTGSMNYSKPLAGTTLITYTYDNNGNLIGKTKVAGP